jgi:2-dehydro-3-deoxyglucarate aldolase
MVNNADEAIKAVQSTRYPPIGTRGVGLARAQQYGVEFKNYVSWVEDFDSGPIVIVQIEHIEAVDNLESILEVEGVDAFIVGPYDLSCSMGIPGDFDDIRFKNVMKKIIDVSDGMGKVSGLHIVEPDIQALTRAIDSGYKFIAYSVDIRMLDVSVRGAVSKIKEINKL